VPTYEYKCKECKHQFEEFQLITASPLIRCPKCEGEIVRLIGRGDAVIFKGSGFYQTDYRSSEYKEKKKKEEKESKPPQKEGKKNA